MEEKTTEKVTDEMLADGRVLLHFKREYFKEQTDDNLIAVLICLRDCTLYVPLDMRMSNKDEEKFKTVKKGDIISCEDEVHLSPDIFKTEDGIKFFPVFSNPEQMPEDYRKCFSVMPFKIFECLDMAHKVDGVAGIVLDAMSEPLPLPFSIADVISELPSIIDS